MQFSQMAQWDIVDFLIFANINIFTQAAAEAGTFFREGGLEWSVFCSLKWSSLCESYIASIFTLSKLFFKKNKI